MAKKKRKHIPAKPQRKPTSKGIATKLIRDSVNSGALWHPSESKERGTPELVKRLDQKLGITPEERELMNSGSHGLDTHTGEVKPWQKTPMEGMFITDPEGLVPKDVEAHAVRRALLTHPSSAEGTDGSTRDLTCIKEFTTEYPVGSVVPSSDESVTYRVAPDNVWLGGRFLEDILGHAVSAQHSLNTLNKNPHGGKVSPFELALNQRYTQVGDGGTGSQYMTKPFQEQTPEEQRQYREMWEFWVKLGKQLVEPGFFKRLIMDGDQAQQFANAPTGPDIERLTLLHPPFRNFYMEFTKPVSIGEQEPFPDGTIANDQVVALTYRARNPSDWFDHTSGEGTLPPPKPDVLIGDFEVGQLSIFLRDKEDTSISDRNFVLCLSTGNATTRWKTATNTADPSVFPDAYWNTPRLLHQRGTPLSLRWIDVATRNPATNLAPANIPGRYVGYWERVVNKYTEWFSWLMLYTIAKGIEIVEEPLPRHERRRMDRQSRKGFAPEPWQIVRVEPTLRKKYENARSSSTSPKVTHGYRYDVRGHLRNGKHKLRDGSYKYSVEWGPSHQRGLKNELYIPKTHAYEGDMDDKLIPDATIKR